MAVATLPGSSEVRPNAIYTLAEVCTLLGISAGTARRWIKRGRLPAAQIGREYRILGAQLLRTIAVVPPLRASDAEGAS